MKRIILFILISLTLVACQPKPTGYVGTETETFILRHINPPKHFYVELESKETGYLFVNVYVSKHCNRWRELRVGQELKLPVHIHLERGNLIRKIDAKQICPRARVSV